MEITSEKIANLIKGYNTIVMYRADIGYQRVYYTKEPFVMYSGLTGAQEAVTFKGNAENRRLNGWRDEFIDTHGRKAMEDYVDATADFGTLVHQSLVSIHQNQFIDWEQEQQLARAYFVHNCLKMNIIANSSVIDKQVFEYCKAVAAIFQFICDNVVEWYAVEGMCYTDEYKVATPIDLVCKLKDGLVYTINLKTSGQLTNKHREQVLMEQWMWNETYKDLQADRTALLRPKAWNEKKGIPTYEFEVVTNDIEDEDSCGMLDDFKARLKIALKRSENTYIRWPKTQMVFDGFTRVGEKPTMIQIGMIDRLKNL